MAHERIEKMKKETGRITNVDLQRKVIGDGDGGDYGGGGGDG